MLGVDHQCPLFTFPDLAFHGLILTPFHPLSFASRNFVSSVQYSLLLLIFVFFLYYSHRSVYRVFTTSCPISENPSLVLIVSLPRLCCSLFTRACICSTYGVTSCAVKSRYKYKQIFVSALISGKKKRSGSKFQKARSKTMMKRNAGRRGSKTKPKKSSKGSGIF